MPTQNWLTCRVNMSVLAFGDPLLLLADQSMFRKSMQVPSYGFDQWFDDGWRQECKRGGSPKRHGFEFVKVSISVPASESARPYFSCRLAKGGHVISWHLEYPLSKIGWESERSLYSAYEYRTKLGMTWYDQSNIERVVGGIMKLSGSKSAVHLQDQNWLWQECIRTYPNHTQPYTTYVSL